MKQANMDFAISLFESITHFKVYSIRPIEADEHNENYLINLDFVLRLKSIYDCDGDFFTPENEYNLLRDLTGSTLHSILPQVLGYDRKNGNMLRKYVQGTTIIQDNNGEFIRYLSLIETLKKLHTFKTESCITLDPITLYNTLKDKLKEEFHHDYEDNVINRAKDALSRSPICVCHCHLEPHSFVYDESRKITKLLNFEYGCLTNEIVDIASLLCENDISANIKERLINAYYGIKNVTKAKVDDIEAVMELLDMTSYLLASLRYQETLEECHFALAKKKMAKIRKRIRFFESKTR